MSDLEEIKRKMDSFWVKFDDIEEHQKGTRIEVDRNRQDIEELRHEVKTQSKKIKLLNDCVEYLEDELELIFEELEGDSDE